VDRWRGIDEDKGWNDRRKEGERKKDTSKEV
jgi:hypothetical protein